MTEAHQKNDYYQPDSLDNTDFLEIEAKWRLQSPDERDHLRKLLKQLGGKPTRMQSEINRIFDNAEAQHQRMGKLLRLRFINGETKARLTLKRRAKFDKGTKQRIELELGVDDGHMMELILRELGFSVTVEYSKTRETWGFQNAEVMLDRLPFGYFCEIEGHHASIKEVSKLLGLEFDKCETRDYPTLMREHLKSSGSSN